MKKITIVITGGTAGIGLATARYFSDRGHRVFISGRDKRRLDSALATLSDTCGGAVGDVNDTESLQRLYEMAGPIDVLFANAGVSYAAKPLHELSIEEIERIVNTNFMGVIRTIHTAIPSMNNASSLIINSSTIGKYSFSGQSVYGATKAGVEGLTRGLAGELAPLGIRVNAIRTGFIDTEIIENSGVPTAEANAIRAGAVSAIPRREIGKPDEIAEIVEFLGLGACFVNGEVITADGGQTACFVPPPYDA
ncbi:SDR family oxidoreductase [Parahaliea maris]|uniref:SDR family oxidoreductase n=1 Tax=Parahaliea maris TaxID=2716870 RepID=A0A5C9A3Z8_9GAMM|nr:SDR family oxidoreductase [Parahaliea maris]TXS95446.1 SDR family oxidoreductase [Parahaliea maris]